MKNKLLLFVFSAFIFTQKTFATEIAYQRIHENFDSEKIEFKETQCGNHLRFIFKDNKKYFLGGIATVAGGAGVSLAGLGVSVSGYGIAAGVPMIMYGVTQTLVGVRLLVKGESYLSERERYLFIKDLYQYEDFETFKRETTKNHRFNGHRNAIQSLFNTELNEELFNLIKVRVMNFSTSTHEELDNLQRVYLGYEEQYKTRKNEKCNTGSVKARLSCVKERKHDLATIEQLKKQAFQNYVNRTERLCSKNNFLTPNNYNQTSCPTANSLVQ